jgi:hypothetical protein
MVSVVIHAGCYKTATSSIQTIAQKNRELFRSAFGVLYPQTGTRANQGIPDPDSVAHHPLFHGAESALDQEPESARAFQGRRKKLAREIAASGAGRLLISTELLSFSKETVKAQFLRYFDDMTDDVTVVYAIRRPDELIDSMNNQMLRAGRGRLRGRDHVEYRDDIEHWTRLLGAARVRVLYFEKSRYEAYLREIFAAAGVDLTRPGVVTDIYANAPMSVAGHVIRSMIFARLKEREVEVTRSVRHEINTALAPIEEKLSPSPKVVTLDAADRERILEGNRADLEAIKAWLSPADRMLLEEDLRQGMQGPHPAKNLDALPSFNESDLYALCSGILDNPTLRSLFASR